MSDVKALAFYLPQFHPIPENDAWWGKGFTEWTNVAKARPRSPATSSRTCPADLGFYDLRVPEVMRAAGRLAAQPASTASASTTTGSTAAGCSRRRSTSSSPRRPRLPVLPLLGQRELDAALGRRASTRSCSARAIARGRRRVHPRPRPDSCAIRRYIRLDGRPLLSSTGRIHLPDPARHAARWRGCARDDGLAEIDLARCSFDVDEPAPTASTAVEIPPHGLVGADITDDGRGREADGFAGQVYDYAGRPEPPRKTAARIFSWYRGVMPSWDNNAARARRRGTLYIRRDPARFGTGFAGIGTRGAGFHRRGAFFVNAWNEWAEGTHLEPDLEHGYEYLDATQSALRGRMHWHDVLQALRGQENLPAQTLQRYLDDLEFSLLGLQRSADYFAQQNLLRETVGRDLAAVRFTELAPEQTGRDTHRHGRTLLPGSRRRDRAETRRPHSALAHRASGRLVHGARHSDRQGYPALPHVVRSRRGAHVLRITRRLGRTNGRGRGIPGSSGGIDAIVGVPLLRVVSRRPAWPLPHRDHPRWPELHREERVPDDNHPRLSVAMSKFPLVSVIVPFLQPGSLLRAVPPLGPATGAGAGGAHRGG